MQRLHITVSVGPCKKKMKTKYNGLMGRHKSLSRPDFSFSSSLNPPTLEISAVSCCYLRDLQFNNSLNSGLFARYFFFIIQPLPLKVSDAEGSQNSCDHFNLIAFITSIEQRLCFQPWLNLYINSPQWMVTHFCQRLQSSQ